MVGRVRDAALANFMAIAGWQDHVDESDFRQFIQDSPWFIPQARLTTELAEHLPQDVRQEADKDMSQNPLFFLVPDWG